MESFNEESISEVVPFLPRDREKVAGSEIAALLPEMYAGVKLKLAEMRK